MAGDDQSPPKRSGCYYTGFFAKSIVLLHTPVRTSNLLPAGPQRVRWNP